MQKVKITHRNVQKESTSNEIKHICFRCFIHSDMEMLKLNEMVFRFNQKYATTCTENGLIRVGRKVNTSNVAIDITFAPNDINDGFNGYNKYYPIIIEMLCEYDIKYEIVDFKKSYKNITDVFNTVDDEDKYILLNFERSILGSDLFNQICSAIIPDKDPFTIHSIRIPMSSMSYTTNSKWDNKKPTISERIDTNNTIQIIVSIFSREDSDEFDNLVARIGNKCIDKITNDYTEIDGGSFFRTIYLHITSDIAGRTFYMTCSHYGSVKIIDNN